LQRHWLAIRSDRLIVRLWLRSGATRAEVLKSPRLIAPWHVHHKDDEAWYVLEGELRVRMGAERSGGEGGRERFCSTGNGTHILESCRGAGAVSADYVAEYYGLIQELHAMKERSRTLLEEVFRKHDSELVEP